MAAKKKTSLGPKVRLLLEQALLEALKRHLASKDRRSPAARKKKAGKKKVSPRPTKKRAGKTTARRRSRR